MNGEQAGATLEELAKKYGYSDKCKISNYIRVYENRDLIKSVVTGDNISYRKALKVLRELKLSFFAEHFLR
jgi:hypothetical protein